MKSCYFITGQNISMSNQHGGNGALKLRHARERHPEAAMLVSETWIPPHRGAGQAYPGPERQKQDIGLLEGPMTYDDHFLETRLIRSWTTKMSF
jgi:hypothetical protein